VAEIRQSPARVGVVLALAVVALFEVLSLLQGVRSLRRLQARATAAAEERVAASRPALEAALARGGTLGWNEAAAIAVSRLGAAEVEVLDAEGLSLFSRPTVSPVGHRLEAPGRLVLVAGGVVTVAARQGPAARVMSYVPLPGDRPPRSLRLAFAAPDLEDELRERQHVLLGHLTGLGVLALAALLVLRRGPGPPRAPPRALEAYEEAMGRLREQGDEEKARHGAERRRMEQAVRETEALARAGELTAGIVHEVRNGLGTILGYARMLERQDPSAGPVETGRAIREECETLEVVVRRFVDFLKHEELRVAPTDLVPLVARVVAREHRAHEGVGVRLAGAAGPVLALADEELLERALENVVRNAFEAAAAGGGEVVVSALHDEGRAVVLVEDDGPGLPPDHPGEIRPFYTTRPGGLGLGLPLARKILLLHRGRLQLERRDPTGVRVTLALPAPPAAATAEVEA
jgi:signal transduction histidine kinase